MTPQKESKPSVRKPKERKLRPLPNPRLPKRLAKLLVFRVDDPFYLAYELGKFGIALQQVREIKTNKNTHLNPKLVVIRYNKNADILKFIKAGEIKAFRVFKHAKFKKSKFKAYLYSTANNLLGLCSGKVIRISSKDEKLMKKFYDVCLRVNKDQNFNAGFDYDEYDVHIQLRMYKDGTYIWLFALTEGLDDIVPEKN